MTSELKPCPFCGGEAHYTKEILSANLAAVVMCSDNDCCSNRAETLEKAISLWNTRAVPDVPNKCYECEGELTTICQACNAPDRPELVRYDRAAYRMIERPDGKYVLHSQAAAIIAMKDEVQKTWQQIAKHHTGYENPSMAFRVLIERAEAAEAKFAEINKYSPNSAILKQTQVRLDQSEAELKETREKLAQWEDQEPVMWLCVLNDAGADRAITTSFPSRRDILKADGYEITPLNASPLAPQGGISEPSTK